MKMIVLGCKFQKIYARFLNLNKIFISYNVIMNWIKFENTYSQEETFEAGTLLKLKNGNVIMVGDVNKNLGLCDCCKDYNVQYFSNDFVKQICKIKDDAFNNKSV